VIATYGFGLFRLDVISFARSKKQKVKCTSCLQYGSCVSGCDAWADTVFNFPEGWSRARAKMHFSLLNLLPVLSICSRVFTGVLGDRWASRSIKSPDFVSCSCNGFCGPLMLLWSILYWSILVIRIVTFSKRHWRAFMSFNISIVAYSVDQKRCLSCDRLL